MNDLQLLLQLKGITIRQLSRVAGVNYHSLQKTIKGIRNTKAMQEYIASFCGASRDSLFGPRREKIIRLLMEMEIEKQAEACREELRKVYLNKKAA